MDGQVRTCRISDALKVEGDWKPRVRGLVGHRIEAPNRAAEAPSFNTHRGTERGKERSPKRFIVDRFVYYLYYVLLYILLFQGQV